MNELSQTWPDLRTLQELGFGPDAALMHEPKLFVDRRFLAALLEQFGQELGDEAAAGALFQIGLLHGLRDAFRVVGTSPESVAPTESLHGGMTPIAIRLNAHRAGQDSQGCEVSGRWPECFEADARLSRLGPAHTPQCHLSAGYTSGWLSGTLDADLLALEESCLAARDRECRFVAREVSAWLEVDDTRARSLAEAVDFGLFRDAAARTLSLSAVRQEEVREEVREIDREAPVVHVWGPVLVLPFTCAEEVLETLQVLAQDPSVGTIRAAVVDLRDTVLDEVHDAVALDQVLQTIESWGAEALLTGISPFSEEIVQDLEATHMVMRKDLDEAIAAAFQIADAQRHVL